MRHEARFVAITQKAVEDSPKAVQEFVKSFYTKEEIFGVPCFTAFETLSGSCVTDGGKRGVAPSHSVDINCFGRRVKDEGLEGVSLYHAMHALKEQPGACFKFARSWDDGCVGSYDVD
ncbi:hypothetical protein A3C87_03040 [Candidatus Kaiserbacteria bacterium RIFCSPHIGHO2_02_FULL_49_34]|uniref:Uncharacterized protein n=1 Tax=Candidatus Kaiserbacteria bacterium RIFCSPHIGHO2_02_FULL_49_34 TaxID=1798491 RepID=A0A1F6DI85_9BACT|nr:MAG: hypothetical protein A3C87_03040 [Candidatus Kaiserbacteria bacterium RIFCSPHIGHO2_02_FULL_49_34]